MKKSDIKEIRYIHFSFLKCLFGYIENKNVIQKIIQTLVLLMRFLQVPLILHCTAMLFFMQSLSTIVG